MPFFFSLKKIVNLDGKNIDFIKHYFKIVETGDELIYIGEKDIMQLMVH